MKPQQRTREPASLAMRLVWFAGLWLAGVAAMALVGLTMRAVLM
jgi:hypothetical protein